MVALKTYSHLTNPVNVQSPEDLQNIDSTKHYIIDGHIDMGSQSIVVPAGGISISGPEGAREVDAFIARKQRQNRKNEEALLILI